MGVSLCEFCVCALCKSCWCDVRYMCFKDPHGSLLQWDENTAMANDPTTDAATATANGPCQGIASAVQGSADQNVMKGDAAKQTFPMCTTNPAALLPVYIGLLGRKVDSAEAVKENFLGGLCPWGG